MASLRQVAETVELQFMGYRDWFATVSRISGRGQRTVEELALARIRLEMMREAVRLFQILLRHPADVQAIIDKDRALQGGGTHDQAPGSPPA